MLTSCVWTQTVFNLKKLDGARERILNSRHERVPLFDRENPLICPQFRSIFLVLGFPVRAYDVFGNQKILSIIFFLWTIS